MTPEILKSKKTFHTLIDYHIIEIKDIARTA